MIVRTAFVRMIVSRSAALGLMAVGLAVLGRLLPPEAFGQFALSIAIFGLVQTLVEFGLRQYVIRSDDELPRPTIESAAGLSMVFAFVGVAILLGVATVFGGKLLPSESAWALAILSAALPIGPFLLGTEALLHRAMKFELISIAEVVRVAADIAVAISLALSGYGAVALACGSLASHVAVAVTLLFYAGRENRIQPRILDGFPLRRALANWGSKLTAAQLLPRIADLSMVSALSSLQGSAALGLFNRARAIHEILDRALLDGISPVILPALSDALRSGVQPALLYRLKLEYMTTICWPAFAVIAILAEPLVKVLLGSQWDEAVPVIRVLTLAGIVLPFTRMSLSLFVALGETDTFLRLQLGQIFVQLPLALIGALVSLDAFVAAYVISNWVKAMSIALYLRKRIGHSTSEFWRLTITSITITLITILGPALTATVSWSPLIVLIAGLASAASGWLIGIFLVNHPISVEVRTLFRTLFNWVSREYRRDRI